ncbi:MAG TPA: DegT/DnrJ/EryC1/StrS family aminotransferase [Polyangia bacterium]|nr:DegT/DnrJ/EryC1/StrS family aminotransferase [Polyangia bacterium]
MRVPSLDLKAQYAHIRADVQAAVQRVLESQRFILGPEVEAFERELAAYCGAAHAVGVSSGTDALLVSLMALGIGPGDEVLTSPYSFFASAGVIARLHARPVFADIDPATFNLDPEAARRALTSRSRAVVLVHLFGQCAPLPDLGEIPILEDAAQSIGARIGTRRAGTLGRAGCLSFFPSKNLGGYGDGGAVVTDDGALAEKIRALRTHGSLTKYHHPIVGGNFRLDALQAAVLRVKLPHLARWIEERRAHAAAYRAGLRGVGLPGEKSGHYHTYNQFVIRSPRRDALRDHLSAVGVESAIYYPVPLHLQPCFAELGHRPGSFPQAEAAARESLALPIYPELPAPARQAVCDAVNAFSDSHA